MSRAADELAGVLPPAALHRFERVGLEILEAQYAAQSLRLILSLAFRPDQPRVPAGQTDGGQWTSGGDVVGPAGYDASKQYSVNLEEEEKLGGHAISRHVDVTDNDLVAEIYPNALPYLLQGAGAAEGRFLSLSDANNFTNRVLEENKQRVDAVASGQEKQVTLNKRFGYPTGTEAAWLDPGDPPLMRPTYYVRVIIQREPRSGRGYRVLTAFPYNSDRTN